MESELKKRKKDHGGKIKCLSCGQEMDKEHFKKHCERKHGNKLAKYQRIVEKGQTKLSFLTSSHGGTETHPEHEQPGTSTPIVVPTISVYEDPTPVDDGPCANLINDPLVGQVTDATDPKTICYDGAGIQQVHLSSQSNRVSNDIEPVASCSGIRESIPSGKESHTALNIRTENVTAVQIEDCCLDTTEDISEKTEIPAEWIESVGRLSHLVEGANRIIHLARNADVLSNETLLVDINNVSGSMNAVTKALMDQTESYLNQIRDKNFKETIPSEIEVEEYYVEHDPALRPMKLNEKQKRHLLTLGPCQPRLKQFPKNPNIASTKQSQFTSQWYDSYPYLEYSIKDKKAYCFVCKTFHGNTEIDRSERSWIDGVSFWHKMMGSRGKNKPGKLEEHFRSTHHNNAIRDYISFVHKDKNIDVILSKNNRQKFIEEEISLNKNKDVIKILLDIARTLARQGISFRGHNESDGNFVQIVHLMARYNPTLRAWLDNRKYRPYHVLYLSGRSINEFLHLLGDEIRRMEWNEIHEADSPLGIMTDTTPDVSHKDQMTTAVRYTRKSGEPKERLVSTTEVRDKSGAGMANSIISELNRANIDTQKIYFQTYDSTSSISGIYNGAQAVLCELLDRQNIVYVACLPHGTNLVIEHGCKASGLITKVYETLELAYVFFSSSTKRHAFFADKMDEVEGALLLRNLSKTRWSARPEAVKAFWTSLEMIKDLLQIMSETFDTKKLDKDTRQKSQNLLSMVMSVDFIVGIMFLKNVMFKTQMLTQQLQKEELDVVSAIRAMSMCKSSLQSIREDDDGQNAQIEAALQFVRHLDMDVDYEFQRLHRIRKKPAKLDNRPETTASLTIHQFYRKEFNAFFDTTVRVLNEKIQMVANAFQPFTDVIDPTSNPQLQDIERLQKKYPLVVPTPEIVMAEIEQLKYYCSNEGISKEDLTCRKMVDIAVKAHVDHHLFPSMAKIGRLMLAAPPSVCKSERSFSRLKLQKNLFRSTTGDERLDDLMLLFCERDLTDAIDIDAVAEKWVTLRRRRIRF